MAALFLVGYAQSELKFGATMATPQFIPVNGSTIALDDLKPTGDNTSDSVAIQTLDAYGYTVDNYDWNDWMYEEACWVDAEFNQVEDVSFDPGQGLWVYGADSTQGLQYAGKVGTSDMVVQLRFGATATGNPFPVTLALDDIVPEGEGTSDTVAIQTLDAYGYTVNNYDWNDWMYETACWVDAEFNKIENVSFSAGQGLWVYGANENQYIRFPAPEL